jgi:hypothetical protein
LLFPQPRKRAVAKPQEAAPDLSSEEKIRLSLEQNLALSAEARRQQEQNEAEAGRLANEAERFTLFERRVVFGVEIAITAACLCALPYFLATDPESTGAALSGAGAIGGLVSLLLRKRRRRSEV